MKKNFLFLVAFLLTGCQLENPTELGDLCPTPDMEGTLAYISSAESCNAENASECVINGTRYDFSISFKYNRCPAFFSNCLTKKDLATGNKIYYCTDTVTSCADGQELCQLPDDRMTCIDPSSDKTCGAECVEGKYSGQDCKSLKTTGSCSMINDKYVCVCANNSLLCGDYCIDPENPKTCGANNCDEENYGGANCAEDFEDYRVCEADESNFYSCRCPRGTVECNGRCIYPKNDPNFCGAKGACDSDDPASEDFRGEDCEAGDGFCREGRCQCSGSIPWCKYDGEEKARCVYATDNETCNAKLEDGTDVCKVEPCNAHQTCSQRSVSEYYCKTTSCEKADEQVCTIDNESQCVSLYDTSHCGNCSKNCAEHTFGNNVYVTGCMANEAAEAAENAIQCTYACQEGMMNCGSMFVPYCVTLETNMQNCGACGNVCGSGQYCDKGTCKNTACDPNECTIEGEDSNTCINTDEQCGPECTKCKDIHPNSYCHQGVCIITQCNAEEHPIYNEYAQIIRCEKNTKTACAPSNRPVSDAIHDCVSEKTNEVNDVKCSDAGICVITDCKIGYHLSADGLSCVKNTAESCGASNSSSTVNCTQSIANSASTVCEGNGVCKVTACKADHHPNGKFTVCSANTKESCGSTTSASTTNCGSLSNVAGASCVSGVCKVSKCVTGYHINGSSTGCTVNSNSSCASTTSSSAKNCTSNAVEKVCNSSGVCACSKDGSTVLNYDKNACVIPQCSGLPGVKAGTARNTNFFNKNYADFACQATACSPGYSIHVNGGGSGAQNCKPSVGHCPYGYKYTSTCKPCQGSACGHAHCTTGYRYYIMACFPQDACCGTRNGAMSSATDYLCMNCQAKGQTCNISTGKCK